MKNTFIGKRLMAFKYAGRGAWLLLKNEASIQVQAVIAVVVTVSGFYFEITATEWILQFFAIGLVMATEGANTAIEEIANFIHPERHPKIGYIKDVAAGAVFFAAVIAIVIGCIIYIPYFN
ncbi:diacylglycerol kinase family protein [Gilvibacter sp.]|uniref:diacylglycerol kinase n=1 Tax=Gilvibacter sp. TaxID=2729997 RepID=UPI0025C34F09|nr:diacylglycerol kinase family protein [Gilvibacter sp.]NQX78554.1 diacylglycerol kinase family protein [Gilvibacter sp.]